MHTQIVDVTHSRSSADEERFFFGDNCLGYDFAACRIQ